MSKLISLLREGFTNTTQLEMLSAEGFIASMLVALLCALVIYCVYRFFYRGLVYSENFNMLLVMVTLITALIIMTVSSNLVLSLGMVGALSIVRFRAAVKDPLDVGFLFWGIGAGLTAGARLYLIAVCGTLFLAFIYMMMTFLKRERRAYLLMVRYDATAAQDVERAMATVRHRLKNKTVSRGQVEIISEVSAKGSTEALEQLEQIDGVEKASIIEYTGEARG